MGTSALSGDGGLDGFAVEARQVEPRTYAIVTHRVAGHHGPWTDVGEAITEASRSDIAAIPLLWWSVMADPAAPHPHAGGPDLVATDVVAAASTLANDLADDLRPMLLAASGTSNRHGKSDGTMVTDADLEADATIVAAVTSTFPDHGVVSEESSTTWEGQEWTWIVDPIDGTSNFAAGMPYWAVSIALAHRGSVVWGLVDAPPLNRRYEATLAGGATCNGNPISVASPADIKDPASRHRAIIVTPGTIRRAHKGLHFKARIMGAVALDLALVAQGLALGMFARVPKVWDVAAGFLLVDEAGGAHVEFKAPGHLPLQPSVELATRSVASAAGPTRQWVRDTAGHLWPTP